MPHQLQGTAHALPTCANQAQSAKTCAHAWDRRHVRQYYSAWLEGAATQIMTWATRTHFCAKECSLLIQLVTLQPILSGSNCQKSSAPLPSAAQTNTAHHPGNRTWCREGCGMKERRQVHLPLHLPLHRVFAFPGNKELMNESCAWTQHAYNVSCTLVEQPGKPTTAYLTHLHTQPKPKSHHVP
jgi:hypothetical protein